MNDQVTTVPTVRDAIQAERDRRQAMGRAILAALEMPTISDGSVGGEAIRQLNELGYDVVRKDSGNDD